MAAIVKSSEVRAERTRYTVAGWGEGELWTLGNVVLAHDFRFDTSAISPNAASPGEAPPGAASPKGGKRPPSGTVASIHARVGDDFVRNSRHGVDPEELVERLTAFLRGHAVRLEDVPLDLASSTAFQRDVATALRSIPRGEVVTYGELAALAGYPGAQRAVGTFCARNRFMFLLPCHRVVAADGIGAYGSSGVAVKRRLLALEGVML